MHMKPRPPLMARIIAKANAAQISSPSSGKIHQNLHIGAPHGDNVP